MRDIHATVKKNIEDKNQADKTRADKHRKEVIFEPGDWIWLHLREGRFPKERASKLAPRGSGPFQVLERVNNNAYRIDLLGKNTISKTFNVADLSPFDADDTVLRSEPSQGGGNDEAIPTTIDVPVIQDGPMTRNREKRLRQLFVTTVQTLLDTEDTYRNTYRPTVNLPGHDKTGTHSTHVLITRDTKVSFLNHHGLPYSNTMGREISQEHRAIQEMDEDTPSGAEDATNKLGNTRVGNIQKLDMGKGIHQGIRGEKPNERDKRSMEQTEVGDDRGCFHTDHAGIDINSNTWSCQRSVFATTIGE